MDEADLRASILRLPTELSVWHAGDAALPNMLHQLALRSIERLAREGTHPALRAPEHLRLATRSQERFSHAASSIVAWSGTELRETASPVPAPVVPSGPRRRKGRRPVARAVVDGDFRDACDLAWNWQPLEAIEVGLATGDMSIREKQGRHVWLHNHRRADVEALDIVLAGVTVLDGPAPEVDETATKEWFEANRGRRDLMNFVPGSIRRTAWTVAHGLLEQQGTTISGDTDLGGLSLEEARSCYALLIAQLYLNELSTVFLGTDQTLVWGIKPGTLVKLLGRYVSEEAAAAFIELCRFTRGRSPISAPLVPYRDLLLVPSPLVSPIAFERTLLRAASADPGRAGSLGNVLGDRAKRWAERFASIPGCRVAERVKVKDGSGRTTGDLDVVAWDADMNLAVVFETKWPIDAATLSESYKVDAHFASGREQMVRLRAALASGEGVASWPRDWNVTEATDIRWWVGSAQQLDSSPRAGDQGVGSTSLRLVEQLLPVPHLAGLLEALESFPMPRAGMEFDLVPEQVEAGPYVLHFDALLLNGSIVPPPERRTRAGWT